MVTQPTVIKAHEGHAHSVLFTRSGRLLLTAGQDAVIRLWSVPGFRSVGSIPGHRKSVNQLAFSPDDSLLATGSSDGTVRIWSFPESRLLLTLARQSGPRFSPSGRYLASVSGGRVSVWSLPEGKEVTVTEPLDRRIFCLEFSPDERLLLAGGTGTLHFVGIPDGHVEASVPAHQGSVAALVRSPDGGFMVSTGPPGVARFWSASTWAPLNTVALESTGSCFAAFSPDALRVSVSVDYQILLISRERSVLGRISVGVKGVHETAWSPDGALLANAAGDGRVRIWNMESGLSTA